MPNFLDKQYRFFHQTLNFWSRLLLVVAAVTVLGAVYFPLWKVHLVAPQYADGLDMVIYAYKLEGGGLNGNDLDEINLLNHYIGMKSIHQADFTEMQILPFMFGIFFLLALRAAVFGEMKAVLDLFMLASYFGIFSIGTFYYRLYSYGHNLDTTAPMPTEPFTPLLFGTQKIANFTQSSYPELGTYLLWAFMAMLLAAIWFSRKERAVSLS